VRPGINNKLSSYITKLTGITQGQVDGDGVDFIDALGEFYKFAENGKLPTCSYGNDFEVFCENARLYNVPLINFSGGMFNIIPAFQNAKIDTSNYSSGTLYQSIGLDYKGSEHNALDDATSVALTLEALFKFNSEVNEKQQASKAA